MTPVSLKEIGIDFEMRKFKLGSDLSDKDKIMSSSGGAKAMAIRIKILVIHQVIQVTRVQRA